MTSWQEHPRYQRALQKLQRMSPDQRAIVDTAMLDESFGDAETRKMIQSMRAGSEKKYGEKELDLKRRTHESRYELGKQSLDISRQKFASDLESDRGLQKLKRKEFEFEKKQFPISTGLGIANVGLSGYLGFQDMRLKQQMARDTLDIARLYRRR